MTCLKPLLPFALIALATPAFAQMEISILPDDPSSAEPSIDLSLSEEISSSEPDLEISNSLEPSSEEPSAPSSEETTSIVNPDLPPPASPAEMFQIFYDTCTSLSGGDPDAYDKANDAGWVPYEDAEYGPYKRVYTGSRDFPGYDVVEVWGSLETYPTQSLGYCRVDFGDVDSTFDLNAITGIAGLTGNVGADGANGVWETADKKLLVIAARFEGSIAIEFNVLVGDTPKP